MKYWTDPGYVIWPVLGLHLLLTSCAGTHLEANGSVCGQPFQINLTDAKDRTGFLMEATCPNGGSLSISSSDSLTSQVIAEQGKIIGDLAAKIVGAAAP